MHDGVEIGEDALLGGRVRLLQPRRGHRAGTDAVLLAAAAKPGPDALVADLGSASGAVGLIVAVRRPDCRLLFVERDEALADLCRRNLIMNGLEGRGRVVVADLLAPSGERRAAGLVPGSCDLVLTNPPFLEVGSARPSPDPARAGAHQMPPEGLSAWVRNAIALLRPAGRTVMIHRADRLGACLAAMASLGGIEIIPVYARPDAPAIRVIVSGTKGSRAPTSLRPALLLHDEAGRFTPRAEALHRGEATLA